MMKKLLFAIALCALGSAASAGQMYKCTVNGKVTFSDKPCDTGVAETKVGVYVPPPDYGTMQIKNRQKNMVNQIDRAKAQEEREADWAAQNRGYRAQQEARQKEQCASARIQQRAREDQVRRQGGDDGEAARQQVRRQGEALAQQCPY
jgi:hypothetical protein